jgi:succinate dehydrogenase / fumarate reductase iron-sulfur subunit
MDRVLQSCYNCRTEFNCTEVCPKEISSTRAIKFIQRMAMKEPFRKSEDPKPAAEVEDASHLAEGSNNACIRYSNDQPDAGRRNFLTKMTLGIGAVSALMVGGVMASAFVGPSLRKKETLWVPAGKMDDLQVGKVTTLNLNYTEKIGIYEQKNTKPVMVWCQSSDKNIVVYDSRCTHLGCTVRWDTRQNSFLCACHGGKFALDGSVTAGPPPKPLDHMDYKIDNGNLLIAMVS